MGNVPRALGRLLQINDECVISTVVTTALLIFGSAIYGASWLSMLSLWNCSSLFCGGPHSGHTSGGLACSSLLFYHYAVFGSMLIMLFWRLAELLTF